MKEKCLARWQIVNGRAVWGCMFGCRDIPRAKDIVSALGRTWLDRVARRIGA